MFALKKLSKPKLSVWWWLFPSLRHRNGIPIRWNKSQTCKNIYLQKITKSRFGFKPFLLSFSIIILNLFYNDGGIGKIGKVNRANRSKSGELNQKIKWIESASTANRPNQANCANWSSICSANWANQTNICWKTSIYLSDSCK